MIIVKNKSAIAKMAQAGSMLSSMFVELGKYIQPGISTGDIDHWIRLWLKKHNLVSKTDGYMGYKHVSCISVNDEVVHGVPCFKKILKEHDLIKVDVCAAFNGYCADMARIFYLGEPQEDIKQFIHVSYQALQKGIEKAQVGNYLSDISFAIQQEVERHGYGVVRDFAGHGIGKQMHEDPEILNYGRPGKGPKLSVGMTFAIEPMITMGHYDVYVASDGWTAKTSDGSLASHVEDTIVITHDGPRVLTRESHIPMQKDTPK